MSRHVFENKRCPYILTRGIWISIHWTNLNNKDKNQRRHHFDYRHETDSDEHERWRHSWLHRSKLQRPPDVADNQDAGDVLRRRRKMIRRRDVILTRLVTGKRNSLTETGRETRTCLSAIRRVWKTESDPSQSVGWASHEWIAVLQARIARTSTALFACEAMMYRSMLPLLDFHPIYWIFSSLDRSCLSVEPCLVSWRAKLFSMHTLRLARLF